MRITYVINMQSKINNRLVVAIDLLLVCFGFVEMEYVLNLNHVYAYVSL